MRVGWRTILVGACFVALVWVFAFVAEMSEGSSPLAAALNASIGVGLALLLVTVVIAATVWASNGDNR